MVEFLLPEGQRDKLSSWMAKLPRPPVAKKANAFIDWLNVVSSTLKERFESDHEETEEYDLLSFELLADRYLKGYLTNSKCRPDVAIIRQSLKGLLDANSLHWGHLAATGKLDSNGPSHNMIFKSTSYVVLHLQARPDLCMGLGIFIGDKHVQFFAVNACAVYYTERLLWMDNYSEYQKVLCAWMWRLYHPQIDPSLTIQYPPLETSPTLDHPTEPTFTFKQGEIQYKNLKISYAGATIGRRTIVMAGKNTSGKSVIMKWQYLDSRRSMEIPLLMKIHQNGRFPGVVTLAPNCPSSRLGIPVRAGKTERHKTQLFLNETGERLTNIRTPREVLMAIYDALEVSRFLFQRRSIFHRDYSEGNILLLNETANYEGPLPSDLDDMCFSQYLLERGTEVGDLTSESSRRRRLATRLLLIDFDCGEDLMLTTYSGEPLPRTGTGIFMARRVRGMLEQEEDVFFLPTFPPLHDIISARYERLLPGRLDAILESQRQKATVQSTRELHYYEHRLCYEAESLFWNLLFWCMAAQPETPLGSYDGTVKLGFSEILPSQVWGNLTGEPDCREFFIEKRLKRTSLHPVYSPLYDLLETMRQFLKYDLELFSQAPATRPDYLHEVFQRLIINFLAKNYDSPFMSLKISTTSRRLKPVALARESTSKDYMTNSQFVDEMASNN